MPRPICRLGFVLLACGIVVLCAAMIGCGSSTSIAFAHVRGDGTLDAANSLNVLSMAGGNGLYRFKLSFKPKAAVATIADDPTAPDQGLGFIETAVPPTPMFTCASIPTPDAVVATMKETTIGGGQSSGGHAFYVQFAN